MFNKELLITESKKRAPDSFGFYLVDRYKHKGYEYPNDVDDDLLPFWENKNNQLTEFYTFDGSIRTKIKIDGSSSLPFSTIRAHYYSSSGHSSMDDYVYDNVSKSFELNRAIFNSVPVGSHISVYFVPKETGFVNWKTGEEIRH